MSSFTGAIRHCLTNLWNFRGRDTRSQFWFYVLGLVIAQQALTVVLMIVIFSGLSHGGDFGAGAADPGVAFASTIRWFTLTAMALPLLAVALIAAAVVRRLHDRGLSGWWGSMPLPFVAIGSFGMNRLLANFGRTDVEFDHGLFGLMFVNNAIYLLMILVLIVLLVKESDAGPNRFGERAV